MKAAARPARLLAAASLALSCASPVKSGAEVGCTMYQPGIVGGHLASARLSEASGIAASRRNAGIYWLHNDSGDGATIYAIDAQGRDLGSFAVAGVHAIDIEDIAVGPAVDRPGSFVYLADIGDNQDARANISIFRVPEPDIAKASPGALVPLEDVASIHLRYPGGVAHDAEAFFVDPATADLYIVTKHEARVFRSPGAKPSRRAATRVLEEVGRLERGPSLVPATNWATGADIDFEGNQIALRTYSRVLMWSRTPGESIVDALARPPCAAPSRPERQGEAIAFTLDGRGYLTVSEGRHPPVHFHSRSPRH